MSRRRKVASERLMMSAAETVGFADKVKAKGWDHATTEEIGLMVGEMVRRGQEALLHNQISPASPATSAADTGQGWRSFTPREMFRYAENVIASQSPAAAETAPNQPNSDDDLLFPHGIIWPPEREI